MTLNITESELLETLKDLKRYSDGCDHENYDACCCYCAADRILGAWISDELEIKQAGELTVSRNDDLRIGQ